MSTTTATTPFEQKILNVLDGCIEKISDRLNASFDPDDKNDMSIYRQFRASLRSRVQWIKNVFAPEDRPTELKNLFKPERVTPKVNAPKVDINKIKNHPETFGPIEDVLKNYPKTSTQIVTTCKAPGLLMKR